MVRDKWNALLAFLWVGVCIFAWVENLALWVKIMDSALFVAWILFTVYILREVKSNGKNDTCGKDDDSGASGESVRG